MVLKPAQLTEIQEGKLELLSAYQRIQRGKAKTADWKLVLEYGAPGVLDHLTRRVLWAKPNKAELNLLQAVGLGGVFVWMFNYIGVRAEEIAKQSGLGYPPCVRDLVPHLFRHIFDPILEWEHRAEAMIEAAIFARHGWYLRDCPRGHVYVARRLRQVYCYAHRSALTMERYRAKAKGGE